MESIPSLPRNPPPLQSPGDRPKEGALRTKGLPLPISLFELIGEMHDTGGIGAMSQAVGMPQLMDRFLKEPQMKERLIGRKAVEVRLQPGDGNHRYSLSRVGLSEDEVQVWGVEIDRYNPQDPLHLGEGCLKPGQPF